MRLATWNVNSLSVRLAQLLGWLNEHQPDVLCLQETKLTDQHFPAAEVEAAGYCPYYSGQKTYNGVAILTRLPATQVQSGLPNFIDEQKRVLAITVDELRVISLYVPNGQAVDSEKYAYKLNWLAAATEWLQEELKRYPKLAVLGDINIAPQDRDVHDPQLWEGQVMVSDRERRAFRDWLSLGFKDSFRLFEQPEKIFSWWDYRQLALQKNRGLRIDHILLSPTLAEYCVACRIDKNARKKPRPSDHAPVIADLQL